MSETPKEDIVEVLMPGEFSVDLQRELGDPIVVKPEDFSLDLEHKIEEPRADNEGLKLPERFKKYLELLIRNALNNRDNPDYARKLISADFFKIQSAKSNREIVAVLDELLAQYVINGSEYKEAVKQLEEGVLEEVNEAIPEIEKEKTEEELRGELRGARSSYIEELAKWRAENKNSHSVWENLMVQLGVEKPKPSKNEPLEVVQAVKDYEQAKRALFIKVAPNPLESDRREELSRQEREELRVETGLRLSELERKIVEKAKSKFGI